MYRFIAGILATFAYCLTAQALVFTPSDFYGSVSTSRDIVHYSSTGAVLETFTVPSGLATTVRGLAFGPDKLLYVVADKISSFSILALNAAGVVQKTYTPPSGVVSNNQSFGKIAFDGNGAFYVGENFGIVKFTTGNSTGTFIANGSFFDVKPLPSGNLLAATAFDLYELTNTGALVRQFSPIDFTLYDMRGLEYDASANNIYVSMLGTSAYPPQIMKFNGATGQLLSQQTFIYPDDMIFSSAGQLIVGSNGQSPGFFTKSPTYLSSFSGTERNFISQYVPEPSTILFLSMAGLGLLRTKPHCHRA